VPGCSRVCCVEEMLCCWLLATVPTTRAACLEQKWVGCHLHMVVVVYARWCAQDRA
jgi:hypothetical protein